MSVPIKMEEPFVSVIIPNYCHSQYLDERILSVLNQTYQNFEIIILDDCSPDNGASKLVIEKYRNNPHVSHIVYNEINSGSTFKQWHRGFELAKGDLVWIAESDDKCHPSMLALLVNEFIKNEKCVLAFSNSLNFSDKDIVEDKKYEGNQIISISGREFIKKHMAFGNSVRNSSSALFKKNILHRISPSYMNFKGAGDRLFWILISEFGNVSIIEEKLNYFRKHPNNSTKKFYYNGINQKEDKIIIDYIYNNKYISYWRYKYGCVYYSYHYIKKVDVKSEELKKELLAMWLPKLTDRFLLSIYPFISIVIKWLIWFKHLL